MPKPKTVDKPTMLSSVYYFISVPARRDELLIEMRALLGSKEGTADDFIIEYGVRDSNGTRYEECTAAQYLVNNYDTCEDLRALELLIEFGADVSKLETKNDTLKDWLAQQQQRHPYNFDNNNNNRNSRDWNNNNNNNNPSRVEYDTTLIPSTRVFNTTSQKPALLPHVKRRVAFGVTMIAAAATLLTYAILSTEVGAIAGFAVGAGLSLLASGFAFTSANRLHERNSMCLHLPADGYQSISTSNDRFFEHTNHNNNNNSSKNAFGTLVMYSSISMDAPSSTSTTSSDDNNNNNNNNNNRFYR